MFERMTNRQLNITLLTVVISNIAVVLLGFSLYTSDDAPIDDSDLHPNYVRISDDENAFKHWLAAHKSLNLSSQSLLADYFRHEGWDEGKAKNLLAQNKDALDEFLKIATYERLQVPERNPTEMPPPSLWSYRPLVRLASLKARVAVNEGKPEDGLRTFLACIKIGHLIKNSDGGMPLHSAGTSIQHMAVWQLLTYLDRMDLPPSALISAAQKLKDYENDSSSVVSTLKSLYELAIIEVNRLAKEEDTSKLPASLRSIKCKLPGAYLPIRTRNTIAAHFRSMKEVIESGTHEQVTPDYSGRVSAVGLRNRKGELLAIMAVERPTSAIPLDEMASACNITGCRMVLALVAFEMKNGSLPRKADELVPDFLSCLPSDPYSGNPMQYDANAGVVFSVGTKPLIIADSISAFLELPKKRGPTVMYDTHDVIDELSTSWRAWVEPFMKDRPTFPIPKRVSTGKRPAGSPKQQ